LTLLVGRQEGHPACKKTELRGAGVVICLERGADLHMAQWMPLPLTVSCFSKIQIGLTFLVPAYPGSPGQRVIKRVCVCVCSSVIIIKHKKCSLSITLMAMNQKPQKSKRQYYPSSRRLNVNVDTLTDSQLLDFED